MQLTLHLYKIRKKPYSGKSFYRKKQQKLERLCALGFQQAKIVIYTLRFLYILVMDMKAGKKASSPIGYEEAPCYCFRPA
jgi:hypothetical protein